MSTTPASSAAPVSRGRFRRIAWWIAVLVGIGLAGSWYWSQIPLHDPRFFGEWFSPNGSVRRFHADGRHEMLIPARSGLTAWQPQHWQSVGDEVVIAPGASESARVQSQFQRWWYNFFTPRTGTKWVGFNATRYQVVEITDSTLRLRRVLPANARIMRPDEVWSRKPAVSTPPPEMP